MGLGTTCLLEWKRRLRAESIAGSFEEWTSVPPVDGNDDNDRCQAFVFIIISKHTRGEKLPLHLREQYDTLFHKSLKPYRTSYL